MESRERKASLRIYLLIFGAVLFLSLYMIGPFIMSVLMGAILAILSYPLYLALLRRRVGPKVAATIVTLGIVLLVSGPISTFIALAINQASGVSEYLSGQNVFSLEAIVRRLSKWGPLEGFIDNAANVERQLRQGLQSLARSASSGFAGLVASIPDVGLKVVLSCLACFFFLIDGRKFMSWAGPKIPLDPDVRAGLVRSFHDTTVSVIWATLAAAGAQAVLMLGAFLILGVPGAILAAGATFIFAWIPILGSFPVWAAGAIYLFAQDASGKAIAMIGIGLVTSVVDNFVRPLVLKGRGEMHPLVSLVAIFGAIQFLGIFGVFVGPIVAAILISLANYWPVIGRRSGIPVEENNKMVVSPAPAPEEGGRRSA